MLTTSWRFFVFLAVFALLFSEVIAAETSGDASGQVWQVGSRRWDTIQEQHFADWVEKSITEDFFIRYGIPVDCADVPYAIRWIYARIARLPAAATTGEGYLLGHWSTAWKDFPTAREWYRDRRFRQSLLAVLQQTTTKTLPLDTYPISIAAESLSAGALFIDDGHSGIVGHIVVDGSTYSPVQTWEATLPRKVKRLRQKNYFGTSADIDAGTGLVRFRWPIFHAGRWQYLPNSAHPYYSIEQYSRDFRHEGEPFDQAVARRIDSNQYDPEKRVRLIIDSLYRYLLERVDLVHAGFSHCRLGNCREGSPLWEVYSTPGRDEMIDFQITLLQKLIRENKLKEEALATIMRGMVIPITEKQTITVQHVVQNHLWLSHNPGDSIEARWGLEKCGMIRARIHNALVDMEFAEQRYRRTDPDYADRRREYLRHELKWLQKEAQHAGCENILQLLQEKSHLPATLHIQAAE